MSKEKTELEETTNPPLLIADVSKSLAPHRCPVCNGNGLVPNGFYMQTSGHCQQAVSRPKRAVPVVELELSGANVC